MENLISVALEWLTENSLIAQIGYNLFKYGFKWAKKQHLKRKRLAKQEAKALKPGASSQKQAPVAPAWDDVVRKSEGILLDDRADQPTGCDKTGTL